MYKAGRTPTRVVLVPGQVCVWRARASGQGLCVPRKMNVFLGRGERLFALELHRLCSLTRGEQPKPVPTKSIKYGDL